MLYHNVPATNIELKLQKGDLIKSGQEARGLTPPLKAANDPDLSTHSSLMVRIARLAGNVVAGSLFLGALLMAPLWLERLVY